MLFITSPTKTLDTDADWSLMPSERIKTTEPEFVNAADLLASKISKLSKNRLKKFLKVSDKLTIENYERFQNWSEEIGKPAILSYSGDVYKQFSAKDFSKIEAEYVQKHLRILTGMYGVLRPYDLIKPHRLDMNTNIKTLRIQRHTNLYSFWGTLLTESLNRVLDSMPEKQRMVVNLSTNEHTKALDLKQLQGEFIDVAFRQIQKGVPNLQEKNIMLYSKQARGLFIRYVVENQLEDKDQLVGFNLEGYAFSRQEGNTLFFVR